MNSSLRAPFRYFYLFFLALCHACAGDDSSNGNQSGEGGSVRVQISGEELATNGFRFPSGSEVTFTDGWELDFTHVLTTVANVTLSENPDRSPSDQSRTGKLVAQIDGPWAVDLHQHGSEPGATGEGTAIPLTTIAEQNRNGNAAFDPTERYAFGYEMIAASADATHLNLNAEARAAYDEMIQLGYSVMYIGTARFKGVECTSRGDYDFGRIPQNIPFRLGFSTPVRSVNCQNQDNDGAAFEGEEFQRGIPILPNRASIAQITLHLDHPFYSDVEHEPALHFDQYAAQLVDEQEGTVLDIEHLVGVNPTAFTDRAGVALPWRSCDGSALPVSAQMAFDVGSVPHDATASPEEALRDYRDYVHYVQSTQGHLNGGEGLCFVERQYPSPN